jgi:predicted nucleic acid-binding protein
VQVLPWSPRVEQAAWDLFLRINEGHARKKDWASFVDASTIVYTQEYNIKYLLSFDSAHFDGWGTHIF